MRAKDFIIEYRREVTADNWGQKMLARTKQDPTMSAIVKASNGNVSLPWLLAQFEEADPTPHKEYVQWLIKQFVAGQARFEDVISRGADALAKFNEMKRRKQLAGPQADINRLTFAQVEDIAAKYVPKVPQDEKGRGQAQAMYEDNQIRVIVPRDQEAACYYGQGTKWCTAATKNNMFAHYSKSGNIYIILVKQPAYPGEKYQFSFAARQYMNEKDEPVSLVDLVTRFPQLQKIFHKEAKEKNIISLLLPPAEVKAKLAQFKARIPTLVAEEIDKFAEPSDNSLLEQLYRSLIKGLKIGPRAKMDLHDGLEEIFLTKQGVQDLTALTLELLTPLFPDQITNQDAIWEASFDTIGNWASDTTLNAIFEEIADNLNDPDIHMDMYHDLIGYVSSLIEVVGKRIAAEITA